MYVILIAVILHEITESTKRNMTQYGCPLDAFEKVTLLWVVGSLFHVLESLVVHGRDFLKDFWNIYTALNVMFFAISYGVWYWSYLQHNEGLV